ncbi:MAG: threonylcarbamoyl-AMP synthase [Candidatus Omnitrophica bacterium]|nr:threonylcarbamoyl-AMP synthase [Candidatus Omnitrophota bacterium]
MRILKINPINPEEEKIEEAANLLKKGAVLIFPTDTVYGIGTSFKNEPGMERIFALKKRPKTKPIAILVDDKKRALEMVESSKEIEKEMERVWPGAVTLLLKAKVSLSPLLKNSSSKVGLRIPDHPLTLKLLKASGSLAATSANLSGQPANCQVETIEKEILEGVDLVIDGGKTSGKESAVWDFTSEPAKLVRGGVLFVCTGNSCRSPMAAGLLRKILRDKENKNIGVDSAGFLFPQGGATKEAIEVMKREEIDLLSHKSKLAKPFLIKNFDLIFVMKEIHRERITQMVPESAKKIFVLDIPDPIGKPVSFYEETLSKIKDKIEEIVLRRIL